MRSYRILRSRKCVVATAILLAFPFFLLGILKTLNYDMQGVVKITRDALKSELTSMSEALWVKAMMENSSQSSQRYLFRTSVVNPVLPESFLPLVESHLRDQADLASLLAKPVINSHEYEYIHVPRRTCAEDKPEVLNVVPSAPSNFAKRQNVRDSGRGDFHGNKNKVKVLFFVGRQPLSNPNITVQERLNKEAAEFGDIVQEDFEDKYKNIRLKAMSMLKWAVTQCSGTTFVLRSDDDISINITKLVSVLRQTQKRNRNFVIGRVRIHDHPVRREKHKVYLSETEYPYATFPPYALGGLLGFPMTTARLLYEAALREPPIWLDDVYITGICAAKVKVPVLQDPDFDFEHPT